MPHPSLNTTLGRFLKVSYINRTVLGVPISVNTWTRLLSLDQLLSDQSMDSTNPNPTCYLPGKDFGLYVTARMLEM